MNFWQPWMSYALIIYAACIVFFILEIRSAPLVDEDHKIIEEGVQTPLILEVLALVLFFGMLFLTYAVMG